MIRSLAKFAAAIALVACAQAAPAMAASPQPAVAYVSSTGNDNNESAGCPAAQPCLTVVAAVQFLFNGGGGGVVSCIDGTGPQSFSQEIFTVELTIDCPGGQWVSDSGVAWALAMGNETVKIRHLTFNLGAANSGSSAILVQGGGNLILEDCVFENAGGPALDITPNGAFNLTITNTRFSNNGSGVLIQPASGGSVTATFDHVRITENNGGGIHTNSSNGPVTVDVIDSVISGNTANGFNVTSGSGTQNNVMNIVRTTIADNGLVGIQVGGGNAAVMLNASVLDSNASGATYVGSGGRILSYGNNAIIGSAGAGFTGSASLQ
jgi:hypothetical protein